jgi:cytoskeletal protein CcmA (bactofilin family)
MTSSVLPRLLVLGLLVGCAPVQAVAQDAGATVTKRGAFAEDLYLAGKRVEVLADVDGDVLAAGGSVVVDGHVTGDAILAGGEVTMQGRVRDDMRAAGGQVSIAGEVGGDLVCVGGRIGVRPAAVVGGRAWLAGGEVDVEGRIGGKLKAAGGRIRIAGEIGGDVDLAAEDVELLPAAQIHGALSYRSPREARIAPDARIAGPVRHLGPGFREPAAA